MKFPGAVLELLLLAPHQAQIIRLRPTAIQPESVPRSELQHRHVAIASWKRT